MPNLNQCNICSINIKEGDPVTISHDATCIDDTEGDPVYELDKVGFLYKVERGIYCPSCTDKVMTCIDKLYTENVKQAIKEGV